jgi:ankyrin repeat protein
MWASLYGHLNVVKLLIEEGADVNARDDAGLTALMIALGRGHTDVAQFLIEAGAEE